jgi:hypothetical protein
LVDFKKTKVTRITGRYIRLFSPCSRE